MTPLPRVDGGFGVIIADPAWEYGNKATRAAAEDHYPTQPMWEILQMPVEQIAAPQAHLYLWVTDGHWPFAFSVMRAWGFEYKQSLVWVKTTDGGKLQMGLGNYVRHAHELCLFGTRGKAKALVHDELSVFWGPRTAHSRKPDNVHRIAERMSPGPRLEMYARTQRPGWVSWGNELPGPQALLSEAA